MNRSNIFYFLLIASLFMACNGEKPVESAEVQQLLDEQQALFNQCEDFILAIDANMMGMMEPMQSASNQMEKQGGQDLQKQIGFDNDQMEAFKTKYVAFSESLEGFRPEVTALLEALKPVERDLRMLQTAMAEAEKPDPSWNVTFNDSRAKLDQEIPKIDALKGKIMAKQDEVIEFLNQHPSTKIGVTHIVLESPLFGE